MLSFQEDIEQCLQVLQTGGLILYPTDTVWGIGCDATNEQAVEKIYALKQRKATQSMIVLVASEREVLQYASQPDLEVFEYLKTTQKPTTVIYEGAIGLADNILAEDGSVGMRICDDEFCKTLIKRFRKPIVSTSANISGRSTPAYFNDIEIEIVNGVDYVAEHRRNDHSSHSPSSVIKWNNGELTVIRP
ncbi:L-threonylcarbamoyladenylate synthase [Chitinophagaceae bacterium LWZ2-11]